MLRRREEVRRRTRRRGLRPALVLVVVLALLAVPAVSFARAMTYPGNAPASVRAVEWVRDHGGGGLVDRVENWWYTRHRPAAAGAGQDRLNLAGSTPARPVPAAPSAGPRDVLPKVALLGPGQPGEGVWAVSSRAQSGRPLLYTTFLHPDAKYRSVVAGVALVPQRTTALHLAPGTREPAAGAFPVAATQVPAPDRPGLVAVFNSGFKTRDSEGGWYSNGHAVAPLRDGAASLVLDQQGRARVEAWQQADMTGQVAAVRQNLHLVVDGGQPVPGLDTNAHGRWGSRRNQLQYTWRSGVGTDRAGDLVYVVGKDMTLQTLAQAMADAGVVTGMELDIHTHMVAFNSFPQPSVAAGAGNRLLQDMVAPPNRYLVPDQRDFFYVTAK
ncbi:MAG: phosphodiester glycosidase family protein [Actinomycetes bacterium]